MRRGYWLIPKHVFGLPSDIVGGKGSFLPKHIQGQTVTFTDGTNDDFDLILLATGYQHAVPFAQEFFGDPQHPDELYLN